MARSTDAKADKSNRKPGCPLKSVPTALSSTISILPSSIENLSETFLDTKVKISERKTKIYFV